MGLRAFGMKRPILGVDPGLSGALSVYADNRIVAVYDVPTFTVKRGKTLKQRLDTANWLRLVNSVAMLDPIACYFEDNTGAGSRYPAAAFSFGQVSGLKEAAFWAANIPVVMIAPATWKTALRVPSNKDAARAVASRLLPSASSFWPLGKHDGRAEASLIALYGSIHGVLK